MLSRPPPPPPPPQPQLERAEEMRPAAPLPDACGLELVLFALPGRGLHEASPLLLLLAVRGGGDDDNTRSPAAACGMCSAYAPARASAARSRVLPRSCGRGSCAAAAGGTCCIIRVHAAELMTTSAEQVSSQARQPIPFFARCSWLACFTACGM